MLFIQGGWDPSIQLIPHPLAWQVSNSISCYFSFSSASIIYCATDSPPYPAQCFPFLDKICGNVLFTSLE